MCGGLILPAMLFLVLYSKSDTPGFSFHYPSMKKDFGLLVVDKNTGQILHTVKLVFDLAHDADKLNKNRLHNLSDGFLRLMHKYDSLAMTISIEPIPFEQDIPFKDVY